MKKQTKISRLTEFLQDNPTLSNEEISKELGLDLKVVSVYLLRLRKRGVIEEVFKDGQRYLIVNQVMGENAVDFKRDAMEMMVTSYLEDFESAELYTERVEIGKMILRILEKL